MKETDRLKNAFVPASAEFRHHIASTLCNLEEPAMKKARRRVSVVMVVLIIVLLAGVAFAAARFGVLDFITYRGRDGSVKLNEALISHVQPIGKTIEGKSVSVTLHDAICDGASMSLAWGISNKLPDKDVYVYWYSTIGEGDISYSTGDMTPNEFMLSGGESREGGVTNRLTSFAEDSSIDVCVYFTILAPEREVVQLDWFSTDTERFQADDKLVMKYDSIELPYEDYLPDESKTDALVRLGYMRPLDTFVIPLTLEITSNVTDILSNADRTEVLVGDYRMILSNIEYTPTSLRYTVEYVFTSEARLITFLEERRSISVLPFFDESDIWYGIAESVNPDEVFESNGEWMLRYDCVISDIFQMPEAIDIVAHNAHTSQVYHPDERFHIDIPKQ